jgi:prepilin-type N-terminal cleavage/methylation domain-containing protein
VGDVTMSFVLRNERGFTLIELAIVLVIIGVLVGGFIGTFGARIDSTRIAETSKELQDIKKALVGYALNPDPARGGTGPYLPCPDCRSPFVCGADANDGIEDISGNTCTVPVGGVGNLPWVTLGLGRGDNWNTRYTYWVDPTFANSAAPFAFNTAATAMTVMTRDAADNKVPLATNVAAVIVSHGKNGLGGISVDNQWNETIATHEASAGDSHIDESNNTDSGDAEFISRTSSLEGTTTSGGPFDDLLIWLTDYELKAEMLGAGVLP